ncbi:MAG TPA: MFS transporter [Hyphomicrobiaceae bacterium]|nr:MFS transporter [Hyphomicrobiaceae bacterium]
MSDPAPSAAPADVPWRTIWLLALVCFASSANLRIADALLAQVAEDFRVTVGQASSIVAAFAVSYGLLQAVYGPVGDRLGKLRVVAFGSALAAVFTGACAIMGSLAALTAGRFLAGAAAAAIIPLSMAWVGDRVPFERRQPVLARFLTGQMSGLIFGQAAGGIVGDLLGWRGAFAMLALVHAGATVVLVQHLHATPGLGAASSAPASLRQTLASIRSMLTRSYPRLVLAAVALEAAAMYGAFAYVGADLKARFGIGYGLIGLILGTFGLGGLIYAFLAPRLLAVIGERGFAISGGLVLAASYLALAFAGSLAIITVAVLAMGFGFYLLHNTLQVNATQMAPEARGLSVAVFAAVLFMSQSVGVAMAAPFIDSHGARPIYFVAALLLPLTGLLLGLRLAKERALSIRP